jgi:copper(I)-binding protein
VSRRSWANTLKLWPLCGGGRGVSRRYSAKTVGGTPMRGSWPGVVGGLVVAALGAAGLIRGAVSLASDSGVSAAGPIVVTNAYVRAPVPPTKTAAAYLTVTNTSGTDDRLLDVQTGAGATARLHTVGADGAMHAVASVVIPAHGSLVLSIGKGHVMIGQLFGTLQVGQTVDLELDFQNAGQIDVVAPVTAPGSPVPSTHSGAHS